MKLNLQGLVAAPHTPFHEDGRLRPGMVERQACHLRQTGVGAAFICGTTGEGTSMTLDERKWIAETWRAAWPAKVGGDGPDGAPKVIVNVGHLCVADSRDLAAHAQKIGVDAFATTAPCFFRPSSLDDLVNYCAEVASGAPDLPFFFYHMPSMTGVSFPMADLLPRAAERIPNFAGIKFTSEDLMDYGRTLRAAGDAYDILFGRDEILLSALALGAKGAIGSTYNFAAPLYARVIEAWQAGDHEAARAGQAKAMEMIAVLGRHGGLAAGKAVMAILGIDCGPVRTPLRPLSLAQIVSLEAELSRLGVLETLGGGKSI